MSIFVLLTTCVSRTASQSECVRAAPWGLTDAESASLCEGASASALTAKCATVALKRRGLSKAEAVELCRGSTSAAPGQCADAVDRSTALRRVAAQPALVVSLCRDVVDAETAEKIPECVAAAAAALSGGSAGTPALWVEICRAVETGFFEYEPTIGCAERALRIQSFAQAEHHAAGAAHPVVTLCANAIDAKAPPLCARSAPHALDPPAVAQLCARARDATPEGPTTCYAAAPRAWDKEERVALCIGATSAAPAKCADSVDRGRPVLGAASAAELCRGVVDPDRVDAPSKCIKAFERDIGVEKFGEAAAVRLCSAATDPSLESALVPVECATGLWKLKRRGTGGGLNTATMADLCAHARTKEDGVAVSDCVERLHRRRDSDVTADVTRTLCTAASSDAPAQCFFAAPHQESAEVRAELCAGATSSAPALCAEKTRRSGLRSDENGKGGRSLVAQLCARATSESPAACYASAPHSVPSALRVPACAATTDDASAASIARCLELAKRGASERLDERVAGSDARALTATGVAVVQLCRAAARMDESVVRSAVDCFTAPPRDLAVAATVQLCSGVMDTSTGRIVVGEATACAKELARVSSIMDLNALAPTLCVGAPSKQPAQCATDATLRGVSAASRVLLCRGAWSDVPIRCMRAVESVRGVTATQRVELCRRVASEGELACMTDALERKIMASMDNANRIDSLVVLCRGAVDSAPAVCASTTTVVKRLTPPQVTQLCSGATASSAINADDLSSLLVGFLRVDRRDLEHPAPAACFSMVRFLAPHAALSLCAGAIDLQRALCVASFGNGRAHMWSLADDDMLRLCSSSSGGGAPRRITGPARCMAVLREGPLHGVRMVDYLGDESVTEAARAFAEKLVAVPMQALSGTEAATLCADAMSSWPARCALHLLSPSGRATRKELNASVRSTESGLLLRAIAADAAMLCTGASSEMPLRCAVAAGERVGASEAAVVCSGARTVGPGECMAKISRHIDAPLRLRMCRGAVSEGPALCANAAPSGLKADELFELCSGATSAAPALCALESPSYGAELDQRHILCSNAPDDHMMGPLQCYSRVRSRLFGYERTAALWLCRGAYSSAPVECAAAALSGHNLRSQRAYEEWQTVSSAAGGGQTPFPASRDKYVHELCSEATGVGAGKCAAAIADARIDFSAAKMLKLCRGAVSGTPGFCAVDYLKSGEHAEDGDDADAWVAACRAMTPRVGSLRILAGVQRHSTNPPKIPLSPPFEIGLLDQYGQPYVPVDGAFSPSGNKSSKACRRATLQSCYGNVTTLGCVEDPRVLITLPRAQRKGRLGASLLGQHVASPIFSRARIDEAASMGGLGRAPAVGDEDPDVAAARKACRSRLQRSMEFGGVVATFDGLAISKPGSFTLRITLFASVPSLPDDPNPAVQSLEVPVNIAAGSGADRGAGGLGRGSGGAAVSTDERSDAACWQLLSKASEELSDVSDGVSDDPWYQRSCVPQWSVAGHTATRSPCQALFSQIGVDPSHHGTAGLAGPLSKVCLTVRGGIARLRLGLDIPSEETMGPCESLGLPHESIDPLYNESGTETTEATDCPSSVDMSTLRKAYRTASLEWHPDRWAAKDKSASQLSDLEMVEVERVFSWLNTAYRRVADRLREEKRARRRASRAAQEI